MRKYLLIICYLCLFPAVVLAGSAFDGQSDPTKWERNGSNIYYTTGNVNVGGSTEFTEKLTVDGRVSLKETTAGGTLTGYGKLYVKSSDHLLYYKDATGVEYDLTSGGGGGGAPLNCSYITAAPEGGLPNERVATAGAGITVADGGAGTTLTISVGADQIKDTMIDWGTGANQVSTADIPEQTNLYYTDGKVGTYGDVHYLQSTDVPLSLPTLVGQTGKFVTTADGLTLSWGSPSISGGNHSSLSNLSYAASGHTGFEPTVTKGNLSESTSSILTITGGTGAVIGSGTTIQVQAADSTHNGYLTSGDWGIFNGKQNTLTISTGLAISTNTITSTLATGLAGGQYVYGGTQASENLNLQSTTNGTRGYVICNDPMVLGTNGSSGKLALYDELGATDYTVALNPNATMVASIDFYLPGAYPAASDYPIIVSTGGVMSYNDQAVKQASTPQFARLGLGGAADSGAVMKATGQYYSAKHTDTIVSHAFAVDWNNGNVQYVVLEDYATITMTMANGKDGGRYMLILKQPSSGSGIISSWDASILWSGATPPTLTVGANKVDVITFVYDGSNTKYYGGSSLNY